MFHKMSHLDWLDVIQVNLNGAFNMARAAASQFREQNGGAMVHMTSTSGLIGNFGQANYMASKLGLHGLSRGIALDMQRYNVRSNCIAPFAWSRMTSSIPAETEAEKARVARIQQMTPDKTAPLAVFLASDKAQGISGQILCVRNNEILLFNQPRPIRALASRRRLDARPCSPSSSPAPSRHPSCRSSAQATSSPGTRFEGRASPSSLRVIR